MDQIRLDEHLKRRLSVAPIIFGQFVLTPLILSVIVFIILNNDTQAKGSVPEAQETALMLAIIGIAALFAAGMVGRLFAAKYSERRQSEEKLAGLYFTKTLLVFVLLESCAILGFVASFMTREVSWVIALSALTILAMFRAWPTAERARAEVLSHLGRGPL